MGVKQWQGDDASVPTDWDDADNWFEAAAPVNSDDVYFNHKSVGTGGVAGEDESAVTLTSFNALMTNLYPIGTDGTPLKIGSTTWRIGEPSSGSTAAAGTGRINLDGHTVQSTWYIYNSASTSLDTGKEAVRIKATHASNVAHVLGNARVGFATDSIGDTAQFATINVTGAGSNVNLGAALTLATLNVSDGTVKVNNTITTVSHDGGAITTSGIDYTITTFNASAANAVINHRKSGGNAITTLNLYQGAVVDLSENASAIAIGTIVVNGDSTIILNSANPSHLTWTTLTRNRGSLTLKA